MAIYKCEMCTTEIEVFEGQREMICPFCGTVQPVVAPKKPNGFAVRNLLRSVIKADTAKASPEVEKPLGGTDGSFYKDISKSEGVKSDSPNVKTSSNAQLSPKEILISRLAGDLRAIIKLTDFRKGRL